MSAPPINTRLRGEGKERGVVEAGEEGVLAKGGDGVRPCPNSNKGRLHKNRMDTNTTFFLFVLVLRLWREILLIGDIDTTRRSLAFEHTLHFIVWLGVFCCF